MFNWLWEKLGGGKSAKKDETADDTTGDVGATDEAAAIATEAAATDSKKSKAKSLPKKANATRAKKSRQASASLSTSGHDLPAKTKSKNGSTTATGKQRRGSGGGSITDFDIQYPKLLAFFDKEGHWNVPIGYKNDSTDGDGPKLFAFSQSLRQHMRHVNEWETEQKKKYGTSKSAAAKNSQLALTPAQVRKLEKASFDWKDATPSRGPRHKS